MQKALSFLLLCITAYGCGSIEERSQPAPQQAATPPTEEERRELARQLLADAGKRAGCEKIIKYEEVIEQYGDLPEAQFARKNIDAVVKFQKPLHAKVRKEFLKLEAVRRREDRVNEQIETLQEYMSCQSAALNKIDKVELDFYTAYRLKHYGY